MKTYYLIALPLRDGITEVRPIQASDLRSVRAQAEGWARKKGCPVAVSEYRFHLQSRVTISKDAQADEAQKRG